MRSLLFWGGQWFSEGGIHVPPSTDPDTIAAGIRKFLEAQGDKPPHRLRLLYHPDSLLAADTPCPNTSDELLRQVLTQQIPALTQPTTISSHFTPTRTSAGCLTFVHHETDSPLPALIAALRKRRCRIEGVWPVTAAIDQVLENQPCVAVVATGGRLLLYQRRSDGSRQLNHFVGKDAHAAFVGNLQTIIAARPKTEVLPALLWFTEDPEHTEPVPRALQLGAYFELRVCGFADLLTAAKSLSSSATSNFVATTPASRLAKTAFAVSMLCAAGTLWTGGQFAREYITHRSNIPKTEALAVSLRSEIDERRLKHQEFVALRSLVDEAQTRPWPYLDLMRRISAVIPRELTLTSLRIDGVEFHLTGKFESVPNPRGDQVAAFAQALGQASPPWTIVAMPGVGSGGEFALSGRFTK